MMKKVTAVILALCMSIGLIACQGSGEGESKTLRVAYFPNITHTQALIMKNKKMLEEKLPGYTIQWVDFNAGPNEMEALFAGEVDLGFIGPVPAVSANVKSNGDVKVIAGATNGGSVLVAREGTHIKTVKDLAGKTVAIPSLGNTQHLILCKLLTENGLKAQTAGGDVNVTAVANADTINLMTSGKIDAALVPEPWGSTLVEKTKATIVLDYDAIWNNGNYATTVVCGRTEYMEANNEVVNTFLEVLEEATKLCQENQENAALIANTEIKAVTGKELSESILNSTFSRIVTSTDIPKDSIGEYAKISKNEGFINEIPEDAQLYQ